MGDFSNVFFLQISFLEDQLGNIFGNMHNMLFISHALLLSHIPASLFPAGGIM